MLKYIYMYFNIKNMKIKELLEIILTEASEKKYSDVHINSNHKVRIRNHIWDLEPLKQIWENNIPEMNSSIIEEIMKIIVWDEEFEIFKKELELDISYSIENGDRFRVNFYKDSGGYSIAFRLISWEIPTMEELGLWEWIKDMCKKAKWLILVTWPTWSWKSTNLAAMINFINKNYKKHIITIEDPIEFSFPSIKSLVNQREIWWHTKSFAKAIRASMREDPDVIMVWEMRDPETIKAAITLAETGHIVFSTLHTNDSIQTIDRIVDVFPADQQAQIRMQLSQSLIWIISQRLIPKKDWTWRIAAREILVADDAVKNLIINWKTHQLYSVLEVWKDKWMILMDRYLLVLYAKWFISKETLLSFARNKDIEMMI